MSSPSRLRRSLIIVSALCLSPVLQLSADEELTGKESGVAPEPESAEDAEVTPFAELPEFAEEVLVSFQEGDRNLTYPILTALTGQSIGLAVGNAMDRDFTKFDTFSFDTFKDGFRKGPRRDDDGWGTNYILHPMWGSETFLRARSQNFTFFESFLFSTACSISWEYLFENWVTHPSSTDLLVTSTVGSLLGELRYRGLQNLAGKTDTGSNVCRFLLDPIQSCVKAAGKNVLGLDLTEPAWRPDFQLSPTMTEDGNVGVMASIGIQF